MAKKGFTKDRLAKLEMHIDRVCELIDDAIYSELDNEKEDLVDAYLNVQKAKKAVSKVLDHADLEGDEDGEDEE